MEPKCVAVKTLFSIHVVVPVFFVHIGFCWIVGFSFVGFAVEAATVNRRGLVSIITLFKSLVVVALVY